MRIDSESYSVRKVEDAELTTGGSCRLKLIVDDPNRPRLAMQTLILELPEYVVHQLTTVLKMKWLNAEPDVDTLRKISELVDKLLEKLEAEHDVD